MKVLTVDDSKFMRFKVKSALEEISGDFQVFEAANGKKAIEVFYSNKDIELIISDWNMPGMDGIQLIKTLRNTGWTVPILMVTANRLKDDVLEGIKAGANNYIGKPLETEVLRQKLQQIFPEKNF
jgi:two-component system chemotaxis response regulator CheY